MIRVGVTDYVEPPYDIEREAYPGAEFFVADPDDLGGLNAALVWHASIDAHFVARLTNCRIVVRYGVGFESVDVGALHSRGIAFSNTPDYGIQEVADTTCSMILTLCRRTSEYDDRARAYRSGWQENILTSTTRISEMAVGVVGTGRIGTAVIQRLKAFGFTILGYDPYVPSGYEKAVGFTRVSTLEDLLTQSDIVTLHCPENDETRGMVDAGFLAQMRPGSLLINTARGSLLAGLTPLENALREGVVRAAGLDVLPEEPPDGDHQLIAAWSSREDWLRGRLIINPHSAYYSETAWREMRFKAAETIRLFLETGVLRNEVLPDS